MIPPMRSIHDVRPDACNYVWDNSIAPALEIESGEAVGLHVRDASDVHAGDGVIVTLEHGELRCAVTDTVAAAAAKPDRPAPADEPDQREN